MSSAALGGAFGGLHGAAEGAFVFLRRGVGDGVIQARRLLHPTRAPNLQALARRPAGSRGAEDLVQRIRLLTRSMGMQGREPMPVAR